MASNKSKETDVNEKVTLLKQIESRLDEICMWFRFQNRSALKSLLEETLHSKRERLIYDLTDGTKSATEIAQTVGVSQPRVSQVWAQWKELGIIIESVGTGARYRHICSLSQVGLDIDFPANKS